MAHFDSPFGPTHPLAADEDATPEALMTARSHAALAWGNLQGRLAHVSDDVAHQFCCALTHLMLVEALAQNGCSGPNLWFSTWYCGLESLPGITTQAQAPPSMIVEALLTDLSLSPWESLAAAAAQIRAAARFDLGDRHSAPSPAPAFLLEEAARIATALKDGGSGEWPLAALDRLHRAAAASPHFAPTERGQHLLALPSGPVAFEQEQRASPLWALDLVSGTMILPESPGHRPLPCPGALRAEALKPHLWPRERAILVADAATTMALKLARLLDTAYQIVAAMHQQTSHLRSTSRAPHLYRLLSGFGPLRPNQIERALGVSKNGVRDLVAALIKAGLAGMTTHSGQALVRTLSPALVNSHHPSPTDDPIALSSENLAAFETAMADIDRLLARSKEALA